MRTLFVHVACMGSRNPDRVTLAERRHHGETVADMWKNGWKCRAICETCVIELRVNLDALIRLNGPGLRLWNRTTACKSVGCSGRMFFQAAPPGATRYEFMGTPPRVRRPYDGPLSDGRGQFIEPGEVEPRAFADARGASPPDPE